MMIVRDVFQAKYGKGDDLVKLFKEANQLWKARGFPTAYVMTDASGAFFTVVTERPVQNLAEWERTFQQVMSMPEFGQWFNRMVPLVENGRREFYNIVESSGNTATPRQAVRRARRP